MKLDPDHYLMAVADVDTHIKNCERSLAALSLPNAVVSHTGALPDAKITNQAPSPGVGL